jgi:signal transduction histidine kinase
MIHAKPGCKAPSAICLSKMTPIRASWLLVAALSAGAVYFLGVPAWVTLVTFGCSILPALSGLISLKAGSLPRRRSQELEAGLWIVFATAVNASAGAGAMSLFPIGVFTAWQAGDHRLTREMAVFMCVGLALSLLAAAGGLWLHSHEATIIAIVYGSAGLIQTGCLAVSAGYESRSPPLRYSPLVQQASADMDLPGRLQRAEARVTRAEEARRKAENDAAASRQRLEARTTFFAQTSHELRTPLNAIVGFAEMMRNQVYGPLPKRYLEYAGLIHEGGRNLSLLVDDVLDLARIESGRFEISPELLSLTDHADEAVRFMSAEAARKHIALERTGPDEVEAYADVKAVRQIALNLISNALKFTPERGRVDVSVGETETGAFLCVSDTGEGISKEDLVRLSGVFEQGEAGKRHKGAGLGLSVVRAFVDLHGGRLDISNRPEGGSQIAVFFPGEPQARQQDVNDPPGVTGDGRD